jgi:hypothetical protein
MKTTLDIPDALFHLAKSAAAEQGHQPHHRTGIRPDRTSALALNFDFVPA